MSEEAKLNVERFRDWQKNCYFVFDSEQTRDGLKQFAVQRGGYKVLMNGRPLYSGGNLQIAVDTYDSAFANKLNKKEQKQNG